MTEADLVACIPIIRRTARKYAPRSYSDDIEQDVLVDLLSKRHVWAGVQTPSAYVYMTTMNRIHLLHRKWARSVATPIGIQHYNTPDPRPDHSQQLIDSLSAQQLLGTVKQKSHRDACGRYMNSEDHDTGTSTERVHVFRGMQVMRKAAGA